MPKNARHIAATLLAAALIALGGTATAAAAAESGAHGGRIQVAALPLPDGGPCGSCGG